MTTKRSEADIERECVEWVFGLTGGELSDKWLNYQHADSSTDNPKPDGCFRYHYEGVPDYAESDFEDLYTDAADYFTAVAEFLYGSPPESIIVDGRTYTLVQSYASSGETECPCKDAEGADPYQGRLCELCERTPTEGHGYIYLGDGWGEFVYRHDVAEHLAKVASDHNIEVWEEESAEMTCAACGETTEQPLGHEVCGSCESNDVKVKPLGEKAWWWWTCAPGCLPECEPMGPHDTRFDALEEATDGLYE